MPQPIAGALFYHACPGCTILPGDTFTGMIGVDGRAVPSGAKRSDPGSIPGISTFGFRITRRPGSGQKVWHMKGTTTMHTSARPTMTREEARLALALSRVPREVRNDPAARAWLSNEGNLGRYLRVRRETGDRRGHRGEITTPAGSGRNR